jgi:hypothetical protein
MDQEESQPAVGHGTPQGIEARLRNAPSQAQTDGEGESACDPGAFPANFRLHQGDTLNVWLSIEPRQITGYITKLEKVKPYLSGDPYSSTDLDNVAIVKESVARLEMLEVHLDAVNMEANHLREGYVAYAERSRRNSVKLAYVCTLLKSLQGRGEVRLQHRRRVRHRPASDGAPRVEAVPAHRE